MLANRMVRETLKALDNWLVSPLLELREIVDDRFELVYVVLQLLFYVHGGGPHVHAFEHVQQPFLLHVWCIFLDVLDALEC